MDGNGHASGEVRSDWTLEEVRALHRAALRRPDAPRAVDVHRRHFDPNAVQVSTLLSIKTGACPEDCAYCPQSIRYDTGLEREALMDRSTVVARARAPRATPARRASAWAPPGAARRTATSTRSSRWSRASRALGLETCATLGMLTPAQAQRLKDAGPRLLQPQPRHLGSVLRRDHHHAHLPGSARHARGRARRRHQRLLRRHRRHGRDGERPRRLAAHARDARPAPGERADQRARAGRGHAARRHAAPLDPIEFVRIIALARILMPRSHVRLSAGRAQMSDEMQALCFLAGANSIFYGEKLLTTGNPGHRERPRALRPARHPARARRRRQAEPMAGRADRIRGRARGPRRAAASAAGAAPSAASRTTPPRSSSTAGAASISAATTTSASPRIRA